MIQRTERDLRLIDWQASSLDRPQLRISKPCTLCFHRRCETRMRRGPEHAGSDQLVYISGYIFPK